MPRVVLTHAVTIARARASKHSERVAAFAPWGTNVVNHFNTENSNNVAVSVDVFESGGDEEGNRLAPDRVGEAGARGARPAVNLHREQLIPRTRP